MNGNRPQDSNIENFVRKNATLITQQLEENPNTENQLRRIYKCKDCGKEYKNFQALGGHRASHKIIKTRTGDDGNSLIEFLESSSSNGKLHVCKICKKGFPIGQALGGHMRMHWRQNFKNREKCLLHEDKDLVVSYRFDDHTHSSSSSSSSSSIVNIFNGKKVLKYDLNLTPEENEAINAVPLLN